VVNATGRLAPSPSGRLHIGHARTFLVAWWRARAQGARLVLRVEDLDAGRCASEHVEGVLEDLAWLGLDWDGPWRLQSEGLAAIRERARWLLERGLAYPCVCTRKEVASAQSAPHGDEGPRYPGTCRGRWSSLEAARAATGRDAALRLVVPPGPIEFVDQVHGARAIDVQASVGDFPLLTRAGEPSYQLAVVVDDARDGVGEVVRGGDLLDVTARQVLLQRLLGLPTPRHLHVPLVVDARGVRLAKRSAGLTLQELRQRGVSPARVVAAVAASCGLATGREGAPGDYVSSFHLGDLPAGPCTFDAEEVSFHPA
jgi:glutamyl-tRNA synthetase